jgi:hypothetical protein
MPKAGARKTAAEAAPEEQSVVAYKGFDANLTCNPAGRPFRYEVGKTYNHKGAVEACASGFHACENPFDVWGYYGPENGNRFARVTLSGAIARHGGDSKIAAARITIDAELRLPDFVRECVKWVIEATKGKGDDPSGHYAQIGSSGHSAQIGSSGHSAQIGSSGHSAQIGSSGDFAKIGSSGDSAKIGSSGHYAQIGSSGDSAKIGSSGDSAKIGSSGHSAQIGSSGHSAQIGSSGDFAKIGSSGHYAQIGSSGHYAQIEASGESAVVACAGSATVSAGPNGAICIPWHDGSRIRFAVGYVGENGIEAGVFYRADNGKLVEA